MLVPCGTNESCFVAIYSFQTEFTTLTLQMPIKMRGVNVVGRQFLHWRWLFGDIKCKNMWFVPNGDWFDEWSGSKITVSDGTHSGALDGGTGRAGDTKIEEPVV